jgi:hypothetical protein
MGSTSRLSLTGSSSDNGGRGLSEKGVVIGANTMGEGVSLTKSELGPYETDR